METIVSAFHPERPQRTPSIGAGWSRDAFSVGAIPHHLLVWFAFVLIRRYPPFRLPLFEGAFDLLLKAPGVALTDSVRPLCKLLDNLVDRHSFGAQMADHAVEERTGIGAGRCTVLDDCVVIDRLSRCVGVVE